MLALALCAVLAAEVEDVDREIAQLEEQRPSTAWLKIGAGLGIAGGVGSITGAVVMSLTTGCIPLAIGMGLTGLGFRELAVRDRENAAIDAELPPTLIESRLPPAPVLLGYTWAF